jgi:2-keto-4-pentenoate hydratase/2-oxohepta-3-ene-1,7-dioic acid hydratase in catechol pathway
MPFFPLAGLPDLSAHTLFCIGRNYAEHAKELNNPVPDRPVVFTKPSTTLLADGGTVVLPPVTQDVHHEVELVVAIGRGGKNIPIETALDHVAGYAIGLDMTARDIQTSLKSKSHPWELAKGLDTFAPIGNFVPAASIPDPSSLHLELNVNGEVRQSGTTADMLHSVAQLIAFLSTYFTLHPGDLIFTGTPAGVSAVNDGDRLHASLHHGLSTLTVGVRREA